MTKDSKKTIKTVLLLLAAGLCYLVWIKLTGLAMPCMFNANPFLFVTAPLLCGEIIYRIYLKCSNMKCNKAREAAVICYGIALCIFGIVRNLAEYGVI